jgi:hypothetical protein
VVSANRTAVSTLRVVCFKRRTARARCVTTHLWTARLWLACLFRSSHYARHDSRHHQSPLLSPPRQACLRHASRAQARAPASPSSYHNRQIVRSPAYSAGLCPRKRVLGRCYAPSAPLRHKAQGMTTVVQGCVSRLRLSHTVHNLIVMILLLAYLPGWYLQKRR